MILNGLDGSGPAAACVRQSKPTAAGDERSTPKIDDEAPVGVVVEDPMAVAARRWQSSGGAGKTMSFTSWELKVLQDPGVPERVRELEEELRLAAGLTSRKAATTPAARDHELRRNGK